MQGSQLRFSNYIISSAVDLVLNDRVVAIAAENSSIDNVWFVYVIDIKCVDHSSNNIDDYGHKSQPYLLCNYLEKLNDNKKGFVYQRSKKTISLTKKVLYIHPLSLNHTGKDLFFLSNNRFIEVLNCAQFTVMGSLF